MESSFCIWLARESKTWANPDNIFNDKVDQELKNNEKKSPPNDTTSKTINEQPKNQKRVKNKSKFNHAGFVNKGNTCYANSILQALSTIPSFWCQESSESGCISPLASALSLNLSLL